MKTADECQQAADNGNWAESTDIWNQMEGQILNYTNNVDFYYVLQFGLTQQQPYYNNLYKPVYNESDILMYHHLYAMEDYLSRLNGGVNETQISYIMNNQVKQQLGIIPDNVTWGG
eukprot:UN13739